ncbi:unnamed protein product, partial [Hapterophycus canaliculatus]
RQSSPKAGNADIVRTVLSAGATVNTRDDRSSTPLHSACMRGHISIVRQGLPSELR